MFPWTFFLVATGYSDALLLFSSLGAFVLMEEDRPFAVMACGFVATLTRFVGIAVPVGLLVIVLQRRRHRTVEEGGAGRVRSRVGAPELAAVATIGSLLCFGAFCWTRYGHPFAFSVAQRGWNQAPGPHTWFNVEPFEAAQQYAPPADSSATSWSRPPVSS